MPERLENMNRIKEVIRSSQKGMNITQITEKLQLNRNLVSKCLDMMLVSSQVELKTFGRSKIYRMPKNSQMANTLSLSSDLTLFIDESFVVIDANDQFFKFTGLSREKIIGRRMDEIDADILMHKDILLNLKDALRGTEYTREISVLRGSDRHYFKAKLIPASPNDLQRRLAIVFENITPKKKAEIELKSSEARYRAVVEDQTELICRILPDTTIVFINEAWCKFYKRCKEEYLDSKLSGFLPRGERSRLSDSIQTVRQKKKVLNYINCITFPEYGERWLHWTLRGIPDDRGNIVELQMVGHDITELRKTETALRVSEENFRTIFDQSPIGVAIVSRDLRFLRVNPELCRILGYSEHELLALKTLQLLHPDFVDSTTRQVEEILKGSQDHYQQDRRYVRKDGGNSWISVTVRVVTDEAREFSHFLAMYEDITEKKRLEESLHMARFCMDNAIYPIKCIDAGGRIIYANDMFCQRIGYSREDLLTMTVWDVDPGFPREGWEQHWEEVKEKRIVKMESAHRASDGTIMPVEITINHLQYRNIEYHCSYTRDISR